MTRIEPLQTLSATQLRWRDCGTVFITAIAAAIAFSIVPTTPQARANDQAYQTLKAACHFPSKPGEAATYAVNSDGTIYCWEQRDKAG